MTKRRQMMERLLERQRAAGEVDEIKDSLDNAYSRFNNTTDPDLLDAYIYEINALRSRYNSALRRYRARLEESV